MTKLTIALVALLGTISCSESYEVPKPAFEVFTPAGLKVYITDYEGLDSVSFLLQTKNQAEYVSAVRDSEEEAEASRWTYWNPNTVLELNEKILYIVEIDQGDSQWTRKGEYIVDQVLPLADEDYVDESPETSRKLAVRTRRAADQFRNKNVQFEGTKSSYQSSYSNYESSDSKPITRSSTLSTTGTFVMKPGGDIEASGYKKASTFDSTKDEEKQWEFSESELTSEELEELKRFVGPNFHSFSELTASQVEEFKRLHGPNFHNPERLRSSPLNKVGSVPNTRSYEESYFAKESSAGAVPPYPEYPNRPSHSSSYLDYHDRRRIPKPTTDRLKPVYYSSPSSDSQRIVPASSSHYEEHSYNRESSSSSHTSAGSDSDYQKPVPVAVPLTSIVKPSDSFRNYDHTRSQSHRVSPNQRSNKPVPQSYPSPSYFSPSVSETEHHTYTAAEQRREEHDDYESQDVQVVEKPKYQSQNHYSGSIFRTVATSKINHPDECNAWSETHYDSSTSISRIQKSISKISCLASVAEDSTKEEIRLIKQQYSELAKNFELLESEFRENRKNGKCCG